MKNKKGLRFPILLKVILLGIITSFVASTVAIVVNYNITIKRATQELDEAANDALEYSNAFFDEPDNDYDNLESFKYVKNYVLEHYQSDEVKNAKLSDFNSFIEYEEVFEESLSYFYTDHMFMTLDYPTFRSNFIAINQILLNSSFYSDQVSYFAVKDPDDPDTFVFLFDSRLATSKNKGTFYHCPGSHYTIKNSDKIGDIGHEYIKTYKLDKYVTRFIEIKAKNDSDELETIGYLFEEYESSKVVKNYDKMLRNEILILTATSLAIILIYAVISYLVFVKNINKLNKTALSITDKLGNKEPFEVINPNIKSRDEIKTLSDSFITMENQVLNYIDIVRQDAVEKEKINAELNVASKIQLEALPNSSLDNEQVSLRAYIKPAKEVGGDFYDYFYINKNELAFIISDVSGKGIPASLFMMKSKELIKSSLLQGLSLSESIKNVNNVLSSNNKESLFVTSFIGIINFKNEEIRYVNAGHEKPYVISNKQVKKLDGVSNFVLGGVEDFTYKEETHPFHKGDAIFLFTDGLNESINSNSEEFGCSRIENILENTNTSVLNNTIEQITNELSNFVGDNEAFDDTTMMIIRFNSNSLSLSFDKKDPSIIEDTVNAINENFPLLDKEKKSKASIIVDELLNNLISYEKRDDLHIDLNISLDKDELTIVIKSNGDDYNPFSEHKEKFLNDYSNDISEGGFGISLVKSLSKEYSYRFENNQSIVEISL